ncbi:MAG: hypothetical protein BM563_00700 [Bacteroidetes bacterium MedPE-SWsnd-G1]|nr:MAG: hypothetical protein BM563_00700 [Bacteroidetes bacterium MedPE-SWsnd-G1]
MAILSKIREKTFALILIIGLALFSFVIGDAFNNNGGGAKVNTIGEVDGEDISREEFANLVEAYKANTGSSSNTQAMNYAWNQMVSDKIYNDQLEKAGVVVGEEDVWNSIISLPFFNQNPQFQNEGGLFDAERAKEYIANMKDDAIGAAPGTAPYNAWQNWLRTEADIRQNLKRTAYNNLVGAGLSASLKEGENDYSFNNNKVTSKFVYVPYTSIADSLIVITDAEKNAYIKENAKKYQVEASRDINYVSFNVVASEEDKNAIKETVASFIEDDENYGIKGLKNSTNAQEFLDESKSDLPNDTSFNFQNATPAVIAEDIFNGKVGDVFGPYEHNGFFKISKINAFKQMPDSVKSRHIIIPFAGTNRSTSTLTKEAAKKKADSVYNLVRRSSTKFAEVADEINTDGTKGKGGDIGWVTKAQAFSPNFDIDFAEYLFNNKKGTVKVVETKFGFHVIKIDDQTTYQKAVQLTTLAREITPSEQTESEFYLEAETFASDIANGADVYTLVKDKGYVLAPAIGLKILDEFVPGILGNQRPIVNWTFNSETSVGDVRRFDVERGYVVAVLAAKTPKGLVPAANVITEIRPILVNRKKAEMIADKMNGSTLEEIASNAGTNVRTAASVTLASPTISGVGAEPSIVGAMMGAKEGEVHNNLAGAKGVFAIQVTSVEEAPALPNYDVARTRIQNSLKLRTNQIFNSLKSAYEIEDYRGETY